MRINIVIALSESFVQPKRHVATELSARLQVFFAPKCYSELVDELEIALLMPLVRPGYEHWYQAKRPAYTAHKTRKSVLTGEVHEISKQLRVELRMDEEAIGRFLSGTDLYSKTFLIDFIAAGFRTEVRLPAKVKGFRFNEFLEDLESVKAAIQKNGA